jgi:hypothetical protein
MGWSYPNKEAGGEDASLPPAMSDERTQESCESETEKRKQSSSILCQGGCGRRGREGVVSVFATTCSSGGGGGAAECRVRSRLGFGRDGHGSLL